MWVISLCAWGSNYHEKLLKVALPSINAALEYANISAQFYIYTDDEKALSGANFRGDVEFRPVDHAREADHYRTYGNCDQTTLQTAPEDAMIAFLTSDIIISREFFSASEKRFAEGKSCIIGTAARTLAHPDTAPPGLTSRDLLNWSFDPVRRHPVTDGCIFGVGKNIVTWCLYFPGPHGVVARAFHLHPFSLVNNRCLWFNRETIDLDLMERFSYDEVHVVVDADEMAFAEISGSEKSILQTVPLSVTSVAYWARNFATPMQRWLFGHRIVVQGDGSDHLDEGPCEDILALLKAMG